MQFHSESNEKLSDKAFSRLLTTSIFGLLFCIVCLCSTTYAWFVESVPNNGNKVNLSSECLLSVTVKDGGEVLLSDEGELWLSSGKVYTVTLLLPKDSASGYCTILAEGNKYYTDYIMRHSDDEPRTARFSLIAETDQTVEFVLHWGIYSCESNVADGVLIIP